MTRLVEAGVLSRVTAGRRNRAFEAKEIINAFTGLDASSPARPVTPGSQNRAGR